MATIPPWIVTPDAAGRYAQGFGIGLNVASQRAAQRVNQHRMALQQQSMEQQRQTAAEVAARNAIQMQLDEQFRKAQLAADAKRLTWQAEQNRLARESAEDISEGRVAGALEEARIRNLPLAELSPEDIKQFPLEGGASVVSAPGMAPRVLSSGGKQSLREYADRKNIDLLYEVANNPNSDPEEKAAALQAIDELIGSQEVSTQGSLWEPAD